MRLMTLDSYSVVTERAEHCKKRSTVADLPAFLEVV